MRRLVLGLFVFWALTVMAGAGGGKCKAVHVELQRLPDLNIPRAGHMACCLQGELTVIGGHTDGFVPTATAEYLSNGEWKVVPTVYPHDDGVGVVLGNSDVLIAGGHEKSLGIGQTFAAERYYPKEHRFKGFGSLDTKRSLANGVVTEKGRVVIAGNWYANDDIEIFDGKKTFKHLKKPTRQRAYPYVFDTSANGVMVIGGMNTRGEHVPTTVADLTKGDSIEVELFKTWQPACYASHQSDYSFIGCDEGGRYRYLMPVKNAEGRMAIALVRDTTITLLETDCEIPQSSEWGRINYFSPILVDRKKDVGYMAGLGSDNRLYTLGIAYDKKPAALTLYYTDVLKDSCSQIPALTAAGNLAFIGGSVTDNFKPFKAAYLMMVGGEESFAAEGPSLMIGLVMSLIVMGLIGVVIAIRRDRKIAKSMPERKEVSEANKANKTIKHFVEKPMVFDGPLPKYGKYDEDEDMTLSVSERMMRKIEKIVVEEEGYLDYKMKASDVGHKLGVRREAILNCVKTQKGRTFADYVNSYRIEHAQRIMTEEPKTPILTVARQSGYDSESSFYKAFKSQTGMPPREWQTKHVKSE